MLLKVHLIRKKSVFMMILFGWRLHQCFLSYFVVPLKNKAPFLIALNILWNWLKFFDILFVFQNYPTSSNINQNDESIITSHYGLTFIVEKKSSFLLRVKYKTKNYSHDVIEHFLEMFKQVFETACLDFSKKVSDSELFKLSNDDVLDEKDEFERLEYYFKKAVQLYPSAIAVEEEGKKGNV